MVVDARGSLSQGVARIADKVWRGGIQQDRQRPGVLCVGYGIHGAVGHKSIAPGLVAHHINLLAGIIIQD